MLFNSVFTIFWDFNIQCRVCYTACSVNRRETVSLFKFPIKSLMIPFELNWPVSLITIYILYVIITDVLQGLVCILISEGMYPALHFPFINKNVFLSFFSKSEWNLSQMLRVKLVTVKMYFIFASHCLINSNHRRPENKRMHFFFYYCLICRDN